MYDSSIILILVNRFSKFIEVNYHLILEIKKTICNRFIANPGRENTNTSFWEGVLIKGSNFKYKTTLSCTVYIMGSQPGGQITLFFNRGRWSQTIFPLRYTSAPPCTENYTPHAQNY
ncbi:hypothetical protein RF11_05782 [Thelohanellus kitauei]|uniref:Uncharacterized protein n=1 Tax=Thelohanellus kitauei TaxID=669202 RepID=A0A0C2JMT2_THEKT|nr:hypothetical protein RF11_05782 [Thelohanellus kitauei]